MQLLATALLLLPAMAGTALADSAPAADAPSLLLPDTPEPNTPFTAAAAAATATFDWNCANSQGPCENACYAIINGLKPSVLTYDADPTKKGKRRSDAGCSSSLSPCTKTKYKRFGDSCDEFPFASTTEGGPKAILRCVKASENNSQGGSLSNFYKKIATKTKFKVVVRNWKRGGLCDRNHKNDGGQFKLAGSTFKMARRSGVTPANPFIDALPRGLSEPGDNPDAAGPLMSALPQFLDSEGNRVALLGEDSDDDSLVGQFISDGDRDIQITSKVA